MPSASRPTLLLDSASLYYRAFYALPESMTAPDGRPHNAVRGFLSTLTRLLVAYRPVDVLPCWDDDWRPQWRVDLVPTYKAHRVADQGEDPFAEAEPESLSAQAIAIDELLLAAGIGAVGLAGYEADDVLASLAARATGPVVAVSGDRDLVQVVDDDVRLLLTVNGGMEKWPLLDPAGVIERFGVPPAAYVDLAVLRGDPSDGLPGVKGIGAKTATALVSAFGDLDAIIAAASASPDKRPMTPRLAQAIAASADEALKARTVATAVTNLDLDLRRPPRNEKRFRDLAGTWGVTRQADALWQELPDQTEAE